MDPDANLEEMMTLVAEINAATDIGDPVSCEAASRLAELVDAMHTWIVNGGALPQRWRR